MTTSSGAVLVTDPFAIARCLTQATAYAPLAEVRGDELLERGRVDLNLDGLQFFPAWPTQPPRAWTSAEVEWEANGTRVCFPTRVLPRASPTAWPLQWPMGLRLGERRSEPRYRIGSDTKASFEVTSWGDGTVWEVYDLSRKGIALRMPVVERPSPGVVAEGLLVIQSCYLPIRIMFRHWRNDPQLPGTQIVGASIIHIDGPFQAALDGVIKTLESDLGLA